MASGEADPYKPLVGRFPEYDVAFLAAMDKALAVLPKDRVQSAKEWIAMMDGDQGNVTPLKVASAAVPGDKPTKTATPAAAKKSNMPVLLGSAAAVALLIGVGVLTMTGGDDPVSTEAATPAPTAQTAVVAESPAPVVSAEPSPELPAFLRPQPAPEPVQEPAPVATQVQEPAPEPVATQEEPAPTPEVVAEPAAPAVPEVVETPAPQVAVDTPTPVVRPATRPESVEIAALPEPEPLPEPVDTPRLETAEPGVEPAFPDQSGNRPLADTDTAAVTLPDTPDTVDDVGAVLEADIPAIVPGNEILPEVDSVMASWSVQLPFVPAGARSNIIAEAGPVSPVWVQPGLVITGVNGTPVDAISDIPDALRAQTDGIELSPTVQVSFQTRDPASGEVADHGWILPVVQEIELLNGSRFETVYMGGDWKTTVAALPEGQTGGLQLGDVITSYIPTSESVNGPDTLMTILDREIESGTEQFMFAVQREGTLWVASLAYSGAEE